MEIPRHWRLKEQRLRLIGKIGGDGEPQFPPRPVPLPKTEIQPTNTGDQVTGDVSNTGVIFSAKEASMSTK